MANKTYNYINYDIYYKGYGLKIRNDKSCCALNDTPELRDELDFPNIGLGGPFDKGHSYTVEEMKKRIDEIISDREKRVLWVEEFAQTCKKPNLVKKYLLESCDTSNRNGHARRSNHTEAEIYNIWSDGVKYYMEYTLGFVETSKIKYLYRKFLCEKRYI